MWGDFIDITPQAIDDGTRLITDQVVRTVIKLVHDKQLTPDQKVKFGWLLQ